MNMKMKKSMDKYRIIYWFNSCTTECYVRANNEREALEKFREMKGEKRIINIEKSE